jgi:hypothetical protein
VQFTGPHGETVEFRSRLGTRLEYYKAGAPVFVLFDPKAPRDAVIDHFSMRWGLQIFLGIAGFVVLMWGLGAAL